MLARVPIVLILLLFGFGTVSGYPSIAGSCSSPKSHHHGDGLEGDGGYKLEVKHPQDVYSPAEEVVLVLSKSENSKPFEGFQIICEKCEFPYVRRSVFAQINKRHCDLDGRVSHTNDRPKHRVEVTANLPQETSQDVEIEYYVVQHRHDWYGPMTLVLPMNTSTSSPSMNTSTSSPSASVNTSASSPSTSMKSEESVETCQSSLKDSFKFTAKFEDYFMIYWSLHDIENLESTSVDILIASKTKGWGSLAFAERSGRMTLADAALGWIESDGTHYHLKAYRIMWYDIHEQDANSSLLEMKCITREEDWLYIEFSKHARDGLVHVDLTKDVYVNYAIAKENALVEHNKFGSATINFASGEYHVTTYRRDYQAHGALMIIAWIVFVPIAILIARYRWSPPRMGDTGWLALHRGINFFVVMCVVVALLVAIITFPPIETKTGRTHQTIGIFTSILLGIQVVVAIFKPGPEEPRRPIFNVVHAWTGRVLFVFALAATFLGISAFHRVTGSSVVAWVVCVVLLLVIYVVIIILIETKLRWTLYREGGILDIGMTQVEYSRLELDNGEE